MYNIRPWQMKYSWDSHTCFVHRWITDLLLQHDANKYSWGTYYSRVLGLEPCRSGDSSSSLCGWSIVSLSSRFSTSGLVDGFAPAVIRFLNQAAWNRGLPLPELPGESGEAEVFDVAPSRKRYATLLADTISVLACLSWSRWTESISSINYSIKHQLDELKQGLGNLYHVNTGKKPKTTNSLLTDNYTINFSISCFLGLCYSRLHDHSSHVTHWKMRWGVLWFLRGITLYCLIIYCFEHYCVLGPFSANCRPHHSTCSV